MKEGIKGRKKGRNRRKKLEEGIEGVEGRKEVKEEVEVKEGRTELKEGWN